VCRSGIAAPSTARLGGCSRTTPWPRASSWRWSSSSHRCRRFFCRPPPPVQAERRCSPSILRLCRPRHDKEHRCPQRSPHPGQPFRPLPANQRHRTRYQYPRAAISAALLGLPRLGPSPHDAWVPRTQLDNAAKTKAPCLRMGDLSFVVDSQLATALKWWLAKPMPGGTEGSSPRAATTCARVGCAFPSSSQARLCKTAGAPLQRRSIRNRAKAMLNTGCWSAASAQLSPRSADTSTLEIRPLPE
jgi:hypothetical protein